jgi:DNA-binding response OmpR family regulator
MNEKILVIDDSLTISSTVEWLLRDHGYQVFVAYDGLAALSMLHRVEPDLILLDVRLPRMNGYQICQFIRNKPEYDGLPIVMLSGMTKDEDIQRALDAGADDYVTKPVDDTKLLSVIQRHLNRIAAAR